MENKVEKPCYPCHVPNDIIISILELLPVKPILRFQCLSKYLCSKIRSTNFVTTHLKHNTLANNEEQANFLFLKTGKGPYDQFRLAFYPEVEANPSHIYDFPYAPNALYMIGSCNGVVCLAESHFLTSHFFLWNPLINRIVQGQLPETMPCRHIRMHGFGYDPSKNDYKLVCVMKDYLMCQVQTRLYTLSSNTWRTIHSHLPLDEFVDSNLVNKYSRPHYVNGALHWLVLSDRHGLSILSFHMGDEVFKEFNVPATWNEDDFEELMFMPYNGLLSIAHFGFLGLEHFSVWVMEEYGKAESWVNLFNICYSCVRDLGYNNFGLRFLKVIGLMYEQCNQCHWGIYTETLALLDVEHAHLPCQKT